VTDGQTDRQAAPSTQLRPSIAEREETVKYKLETQNKSATNWLFLSGAITLAHSNETKRLP